MRRAAARSGWRRLRLAALVIALTAVGCGGGSSRPEPANPTVAAPAGLRLVAIGDSIPYNSPDDCPGCAGFVDRYAQALGVASGKQVTVDNLSQHNGLTLPMLMDELATFRTKLSSADVIVIGIAHNSTELNEDHPCGGDLDANMEPDWSKTDRACAVASAAKYRPQFERLFATVAGWRQGKPTILRTINRYNDWIGAPNLPLTKADGAKTTMFFDLWNAMLCPAATKSGFVCADIYHRFNGPRGDKPSGDLLAQDYTHPSDKGNEAIADVLVAEGFAPLA